MQSAFEGYKIGGAFHVYTISVKGYCCNFLYTFIGQQGECVLGYDVFNKVFLEVLLMTVFMKVLLSITFIVGVSL